jgi:hypothetical protein
MSTEHDEAVRRGRRNRSRGASAEREAIAILGRFGVLASRSASAQASRWAKATSQQQPDLVVAPKAGLPPLPLWVEVKASPSSAALWSGLRQACDPGLPVVPLVMWRIPGAGPRRPVRWVYATTTDRGDVPGVRIGDALSQLDDGAVVGVHVRSPAGRCVIFGNRYLRMMLRELAARVSAGAALDVPTLRPSLPLELSQTLPPAVLVHDEPKFDPPYDPVLHPYPDHLTDPGLAETQPQQRVKR